MRQFGKPLFKWSLGQLEHNDMVQYLVEAQCYQQAMVLKTVEKYQGRYYLLEIFHKKKKKWIINFKFG